MLLPGALLPEANGDSGILAPSLLLLSLFCLCNWSAIQLEGCSIEGRKEKVRALGSQDVGRKAVESPPWEGRESRMCE